MAEKTEHHPHVARAPQREKVKKKVAEAKKKAKKAAKKDVTWKSNSECFDCPHCPALLARLIASNFGRNDADKDKDLGIPSKFPFKDQILAEAAELKARVSLRSLR